MPAWLPCLSTLRRLFTAQYLSFDSDGVFTGNPNRGKVSRNQAQPLVAPPVPAPRPRPSCNTRFGPTRALPPRVQKPPLKVLTRLESLGLLTSLSETGLLSGAESAGLFSKLEAAGAFSKAEKLLPLADTFGVFGLLESLLLVDSSVLLLGGAAALLAGAARGGGFGRRATAVTLAFLAFQWLAQRSSTSDAAVGSERADTGAKGIVELVG